MIPPLSALQAVHARLKPYIHRTPLLRSASLSKLTGHDVYFKAEMLQKTGSFKPRGAFNRLLRLTAEERARGVVAVSGGNHAQAMGYASPAAGAARCALLSRRQILTAMPTRFISTCPAQGRG